LSSGGALSSLLKREQMVVGAALLTIAVLAWTYMLGLAAGMNAASAGMAGMDMQAMPGMDMMEPQFRAWTPALFGFMFSMWTVMMVGMMLPSAAPMILIYTQVARQATTLGKTFVSAGWFTAGYLAAWIAFSLAATSAQWALEEAALLSPMMVSVSSIFGGIVLINAGIYQFTPVKDACLDRCRSPLSFVQQHGGFKGDAYGAARLGVLHGFYCIGCCWVLMALLFVGGVMNILWIAGLMIFILLEKVLPGGRYLTRLAGVAVAAAGVGMLAGFKL
jgi:predicted metal-binding membrane protein